MGLPSLAWDFFLSFPSLGIGHTQTQLSLFPGFVSRDERRLPSPTDGVTHVCQQRRGESAMTPYLPVRPVRREMLASGLVLELCHGMSLQRAAAAIVG